MSTRLATNRNGARRKNAKFSTLTLTAVIRKDGRWYVAECPEVGTVSQGKSLELALANLKEATELYLEEFPLKKITRPLLTTFEATAYA